MKWDDVWAKHGKHPNTPGEQMNDLAAILRADADRAAAGGPGHRRPCNSMPADPTDDHRVCFALADVESAVRGAVSLGATEDELEAIVYEAIVQCRRK